MKTDPPVGDDLTVLLSTVKERVLTKAVRARPRTRRLGATSLIVGAIAVLGLGTAGTAIAASYVASVTTRYEIPRTTNRPSDPPPPADYDQVTNNELEPNEASLGQLWAGVSGDFRDDQGASVATESWTPDFLTDFAAAITDRCYPLRTADEAAELEQLKVNYEAQTGAEGHALAQLYFDRATELCM